MVYNFLYKWSCGVNTSAMRARSEILPTPNKFSGVKTKIIKPKTIRRITHQLLENMKNEKHTYLLYIIFVLLIEPICN